MNKLTVIGEKGNLVTKQQNLKNWKRIYYYIIYRRSEGGGGRRRNRGVCGLKTTTKDGVLLQSPTRGRRLHHFYGSRQVRERGTHQIRLPRRHLVLLFIFFNFNFPFLVQFNLIENSVDNFVNTLLGFMWIKCLLLMCIWDYTKAKLLMILVKAYWKIVLSLSKLIPFKAKILFYPYTPFLLCYFCCH